jgi:hypothetical protein
MENRQDKGRVEGRMWLLFLALALFLGQPDTDLGENRVKGSQDDPREGLGVGSQLSRQHVYLSSCLNWLLNISYM